MKKGCAIISIIFLVLILVAGFIGYPYYKKNYANNVKKEGFVKIPKNSNFKAILDSIRPFVDDIKSFEEVAITKKLAENFKAGRYKIESGASNSNLINMIKAGNQTEDTFRIGDFFSVYQMIGRVSKKTEADSLDFAKSFEAIAKEKGLKNAEDLKPYFMMDSYNFYWTVSPEDFFKKFETQYNEFWTADREALEKKSGLSRSQIYALASIVYKESGGKSDEMKTIAGLYINRFHKGMKLQSDPTVIYAVLQSANFSIAPMKRVYYKDLKNPSPYNTYAHTGIPPGPICIPNKDALDAVLNAEKNNYIFMCADPERIGFHKFTNSDTEHAANAKAYQDWLNKNNVK
ncbi:endolytic transglycosylase MltG [Amniculibacterium sp. G2-70]|uniref:endolytic transglycosylase MltG n=1 Tax=Amniculibacterium sp. G2-70 TaxID=2767188 RepID=UPI001653F3C9|nr:endolytic transglycosylase MltG [Amniculibacterium sp. G2-70]